MTAALGAITAVIALAALGSPVGEALADEAESFLFFRSIEKDGAPVGVGTANWRIGTWTNALENRLSRENVLLGEGLGVPAFRELIGREGFDRVPFHNGYITYLVKEGIVGLATFLALVLPAAVRAARLARARQTFTRSERMFALAVLGGIMVFMGNMMFAAVVETPTAAAAFWLLVGVAYTLPRVPSPRRILTARTAGRSPRMLGSVTPEHGARSLASTD